MTVGCGVLVRVLVGSLVWVGWRVAVAEGLGVLVMVAVAGLVSVGITGGTAVAVAATTPTLTINSGPNKTPLSV